MSSKNLTGGAGDHTLFAGPTPDLGSSIQFPDSGSGFQFPDSGSGFQFPDSGSGNDQISAPEPTPLQPPDSEAGGGLAPDSGSGNDQISAPEPLPAPPPVPNPNPLVVSSGGDPIIIPLDGNKYSLAPHIKYVNLFFDYKNKIFINAQVDLLSKPDFPDRIYWDTGFSNIGEVSHIYSNSYYRRFFIYFDGECLEINADTLDYDILTKLSNIKVIQFTPKTGIKSVSFNKIYPLLNSTKGLKLGFNNIIFTLISDINTDDRHYIELTLFNCSNQSKLYGALVNSNKIIKISNIVGPELFNSNVYSLI